MNRDQPNIFRSAALLAVVAVLGAALLAAVHALTRDRIEAQERRVILEQLHQVLPDSSYDNTLHEDVISFADPAYFRSDEPVTVYRARKAGRDVAVIMRVAAPDGYNGAIHLMIGIYADGTVSGVRVISHRETPGLGDPVELARSDWILGFDGRSLDDPGPQGWAVKRDGGIFDQFTGATITPRAVVETVERVLMYFRRNREMLFAPREEEES